MTENEISRVIIECAIEVHRTLGGPGLLENVYEEAMAWELSQRDFKVQRRKAIPYLHLRAFALKTCLVPARPA